METHENDHRYVTFPISDVHEGIRENLASHEEEICDSSNTECILPDSLNDVEVTDVDGTITEAQVAVAILTEQSDDDEEKSLVYPIYIKEEEHHRYTSGDDESMAVEALRQLGGMYQSTFETKKHRCQKCSLNISQSELAKHHETCTAVKLHSCTTCGENFERKQDYENHVVCHQVDRPHSCRTCGNLFRSKANLQTHMRQVHRAEKPHRCTICGSDFHRPSSLSNHMKIHTYVAGRALVSQQPNQPETLKKWPIEQETQNSTASTYDVQWSVPYNFTTENVDGLPVNSEKIDTLQEFTVMPNGEVAQFEYTAQDPLTSPINEQYDIAINDYSQTTDNSVKGETLAFATIDQSKNYVEVDLTQGKSHVCAHCGAIFSRATALASHEKIHASKTSWSMPVECEYCDKQFQDSIHLANHQTTCAKKLMRSNGEQSTGGGKWGKHACPECDKKFTTKQKMFRHHWIHRKKTHSCEMCGTQFEKQNQLDEHRLSAHPGDSPFTCTECGKSFVSRQGLWEHGRTHAGSPAHFHCDTCSKTFASRQGYLIHRRTHTGERPYGCKFCWKAFRDGGTLRKHERIHTGERPHVCPLCSRAFNQKVVLREHVRWVHAAGKNETDVNGPPYPCPLCSIMNQDRDELCAHIVKHSDQMIAEAKAKTNNNASKVKTTRKSKSRASASLKTLKNSTDHGGITKGEEDQALMSITVNHKDKCVIIDGVKDDAGDISDEDGTKTDHLPRVEEQTIVDEIGDSDILQLVRKGDTLRLSVTGRNNDTLHFITKQNQSLPVLAIRNPQSHENFSCQINDADIGESGDIADNGGEDECMMEEETRHVNVEQVTRYIHESERRESDDDEDEDDEMVCGICGDDFDDKNVLMEHVKIHI